MNRRTAIRRLLAVPFAAAAALPVFRHLLRPSSAPLPVTTGGTGILTLDEPLDVAFTRQAGQAAAERADELLMQYAKPIAHGEITFEACWSPPPQVMQVGDEIRITMPDGEEYFAEVSLVTAHPGPTVDSVSVSAELTPRSQVTLKPGGDLDGDRRREWDRQLDELHRQPEISIGHSVLEPGD